MYPSCSVSRTCHRLKLLDTVSNRILPANADPGYGSGDDGNWNFPSSAAGPANAHMQDAYNDLLTGSRDLFSGPSSSSYDRDDDPYDYHIWDRIELLPPDQQRKEIGVMSPQLFLLAIRTRIQDLIFVGRKLVTAKCCVQHNVAAACSSAVS